MTNRRLYCVLTGVAAVLSISTSLCLPAPVFQAGVAVLMVVTSYLLIVHWTVGNVRRFFPKEPAVGIIFSIGTVLAPLARSSNYYLLFPCAVFGFLCWANSAAIEVWEGGDVDAVSSWIVRHLEPLSITICLITLFLPTNDFALFIASLGFAVIVHFRHRLSPDSLRVAIDLPLVAPLFLLLR